MSNAVELRVFDVLQIIYIAAWPDDQLGNPLVFAASVRPDEPQSQYNATFARAPRDPASAFVPLSRKLIHVSEWRCRSSGRDHSGRLVQVGVFSKSLREGAKQ